MRDNSSQVDGVCWDKANCNFFDKIKNKKDDRCQIEEYIDGTSRIELNDAMLSVLIIQCQ